MQLPFLIGNTPIEEGCGGSHGGPCSWLSLQDPAASEAPHALRSHDCVVLTICSCHLADRLLPMGAKVAVAEPLGPEGEVHIGGGMMATLGPRAVEPGLLDTRMGRQNSQQCIARLRRQARDGMKIDAVRWGGPCGAIVARLQLWLVRVRS